MKINCIKSDLLKLRIYLGNFLKMIPLQQCLVFCDEIWGLKCQCDMKIPDFVILIALNNNFNALCCEFWSFNKVGVVGQCPYMPYIV